jgi:hypothetical protein
MQVMSSLRSQGLSKGGWSMMRDTFGSPLRRRLSGRRSPKLPPPPFRTSPVRVVANVAVAGFVLANMILAYQLLGEDRSSIAVVRARSEHGGAGSTAFERLNEALDNLSSSKLGVPLPTTANANQAGRSGRAESFSTTFTASRLVTSGSDASSSSSPGSSSRGSTSSDEGSMNESTDDSNEGSSDNGSDDEESDDNGSDDEESDDGGSHDDDSDEDSGDDPAARSFSD